MKSPLRKIRGLGHAKEKKRREGDATKPPTKFDELEHAAEVVEEMRSCYDSLLSAAAAATNSVYEFKEALEEMGTCLLEKTASIDDEDNSRALMMMGKAQFELQKLVDSYRSNIIRTITNPSESLLKELETLEEMKQQCDEKRQQYDDMRTSYMEKKRSKSAKVTSCSPEKLQAARLEYEEEARRFSFRLSSLKRGQSRSLLIQAARHHAAQLNFFRRGVKYLEKLEPHVRAVAETRNINHHFSGLQDDDSDTEDGSSIQDYHSDDGELSFDYNINDRDRGLLASRKSMELEGNDKFSSELLREQDQGTSAKSESKMSSLKPEISSLSAPLSARAAMMPEPREGVHHTRQRTFESFVLPTPVDDRTSYTTNMNVDSGKSKGQTNLWHSSPLIKGNNVTGNVAHTGLVRMPSPTEGISLKPSQSEGMLRTPSRVDNKVDSVSPRQPFYSYATPDNKKMRREREYFSGPIPSSSASSKQFLSTDHSRAVPAAASKQIPGRLLSSPSNVSPIARSPKISELHELPRPPPNLEVLGQSGLVGYSGPLVYRRQAPVTPTMMSRPSPTASPLPMPPPTPAMSRSYSIPSNSQRVPILTVEKLLEARHGGESNEGVFSRLPVPVLSENVGSESIMPLQSTTGGAR